MSAEEIVRHHEFDPDAVEYLVPPTVQSIAVVAYDPRWPAAFDAIAERIRRALGDTARAVEHVGSTSVPGLPAKPIIDIDLTVPDSRDEEAYRGPLESEGFVLVLREPRWHEHRLARFEEPLANIHIWSPDCPETIRHRMLRDWLIAHPEDRDRYAEAKLASAEAINATGGGFVMDYNQRKQPVIRDILDRMFRARGLVR